jgi:DNA-binding NarL/FixJ family response regulator
MIPETSQSNAFGARAIALVIDDAPETLGVISEALEANGMTVLVARSGPEGIALTHRVQPDVILLDAQMPGMDGFETCRVLKANPASADAPVIFMTGLTDAEYILKGLQSGGVDYITKPVVLDELVARIITHVLNARAISSARHALDETGQSLLAFDKNCGFVWGTPKALDLVDTAEGTKALLSAAPPRAFSDWLSGLGQTALSRSTPLMIGQLVLKYVGTTNGQTLIEIHEMRESSPIMPLIQAHGLTEREAEVLLWLSQGKTNKDIAEILSLSARTVNKHLEQVFYKMGVDNRTSAAVMADRLLHRA